MIQNSLQIGEEKKNSSIESPASDRAKILRRMEELEDRVDEL